MIFKKITGVSPVEYRNKYNKGQGGVMVAPPFLQGRENTIRPMTLDAMKKYCK